MLFTKLESDCVEAMALGALAAVVPAAFFLGLAMGLTSLLSGQLVLGRLNLLNAQFWRGQVLGHGAAQLLNGLAHFAPHFKMGLVGLLLATHLVAAQLFFRLRGAKQVGRQLGAAHVVQNFLALLQLFACVNVPVAHAAVQALVAVVLKNRVVQRRIHPRIFGCCGQVLVVGGQLVADGQALVVLIQLRKLVAVGQLLPARLQGKVGLAIGNHGFAGLAVLHHQIAGVAGEANVGQLALGTRANLDHFEDILEMVCLRLATVAARLKCTGHHGQKMTVFRIVQHFGQLTSPPIFVAVSIHMPNALKRGMVLREFVVRHVISPVFGRLGPAHGPAAS